MTTKWRTSKCSSGRDLVKGLYGKIKRFAQLDQVRSVRLSTAGKYEKGAVSGAGVGSHSTVTCRTTVLFCFVLFGLQLSVCLWWLQVPLRDLSDA